MGESIKEGSIAAVLKKVGQPVREDEVIAQIETDKVTIDVKSPSAGVLQQLLVKPADLVVAGQLVAVVGASAPAVGVVAASAAGAAPAGSAQPVASTSDRSHMISFPPRTSVAGVRISSLPDAEYATALAAAEAAAKPAEKPTVAEATVAEPAAPAAAPGAPAVTYPMPAAKAAPPPKSKNKLQYITRPDGRGGPPRRPLTERELEMVNLGGVY